MPEHTAPAFLFAPRGGKNRRSEIIHFDVFPKHVQRHVGLFKSFILFFSAGSFSR
jgi:hypothetical protein